MTFVELVGQLSTDIFDFYDTAFTQSEKRAFVNRAMQHVANLISASSTNYMLATWQGALTNGGDAPYVLVDLSTPLNPPVVRIVRARRTDTGLNSDDKSLEIIEFQDAEKKAWGSALPRPQVFQYNSRFGFVRPPQTGFEAEVVYVQQVPNMNADGDTPGEQDFVGTPNVIPLAFHGLIVTYAAVLALTAQNANNQQMTKVFVDQVTGMGLRLPQSRIVQETPRVNTNIR